MTKIDAWKNLQFDRNTQGGSKAAPRIPYGEAVKLASVRQPNEDYYWCGVRTTLAVARHFGHHLTTSIADFAGIMGVAEKSGTNWQQIKNVLRDAQIATSNVVRDMTFDDIVNALRKGDFPIICYDAYAGYDDHKDYPKKADGSPDWVKFTPDLGLELGHYSVVVAADERGVWLMDPAADRKEVSYDDDEHLVAPRGFIPREEFEARFYDFKKPGGFGLYVYASQTTARDVGEMTKTERDIFERICRKADAENLLQPDFVP